MPKPSGAVGRRLLDIGFVRDALAALPCKHGPARYPCAINPLPDLNITPYIPVIDRSRQRDAFLTRDTFRYDREADACRRPAIAAPDAPARWFAYAKARSPIVLAAK